VDLITFAIIGPQKVNYVIFLNPNWYSRLEIFLTGIRGSNVHGNNGFTERSKILAGCRKVILLNYNIN